MNLYEPVATKSAVIEIYQVQVQYIMAYSTIPVLTEAEQPKW